MKMRFRMRKSCFFLLVLLVVLLQGAWALSFQWAPVDPLFREPLADPFAPSSSFRSLTVTDESGIPDSVLASNKEDQKYEKLQYDDEGQLGYWQMKSAVNIGVLRVSEGFFQAEGYIQGGLNTLFQKEGTINALGFDGFYGAGVTVRLFDKVAIQGGFHHFSGHWGDEIIGDLLEYNDSIDLYGDSATYHLEEYTRGNSWMAGLSVEPTERWRVYCFAELPMRHAWIRPGIHVPASTRKPGSEDSQFDHITGQENLTGLSPYDSSYKAWRLQAGGELRFPVSDVGSFFLAADVQAHQDGKTKHQVGSYDKDNPWEWEYTAGGGFEFNKGILDRKVRLECYYHDGRIPLLNYFFQRSKYVVMGIAISG